MCICINCLYVHKCATYRNIQEQHGKSLKMNESLFHPLEPIVHVNLYNVAMSFEIDWDITECLSFIDKPGNWVIVL